MSAQDGGPAFPVVGMRQQGDQTFIGVFNSAYDSPEQAADSFYEMADAMLKARTK